jgi:hypothetical protein
MRLSWAGRSELQACEAREGHYRYVFVRRARARRDGLIECDNE